MRDYHIHHLRFDTTRKSVRVNLYLYAQYNKHTLLKSQNESHLPATKGEQMPYLQVKVLCESEIFLSMNILVNVRYLSNTRINA
jgi:hypothetical protein